MAEQQLFLETDLIRQAQNGSSAAYGELYVRHLAAISHYIQKRVGESSEVEDLTQTVFVKAWQALRDYQPSGAPFRAWLYRIAHNAVIDHYRIRRHSLLWDDLTWMTDPQGTPEMQVLDTERHETVRDAITHLRPAYQAVIVRRFLQNLDYSETAAELGQQVNHVRVVQHRALEALRRVLTQESALWLATAVTIMSLLLGGKIVVAAEQALPGDRFYPMRTWAEDATLVLTDDATDVRLHTRFALQRISALDALYHQGRRDDMTAAVTAAAVHIRAASAKFAVVTQTEPTNRSALTEQFISALHDQSDALQTLTLAVPETAQTVQPLLTALTDAQQNLQGEDAAAPLPTATVTPSATPTRLLIPTPTPAVAGAISLRDGEADASQAAPSLTPTRPAIAVEAHLQEDVGAADRTEQQQISAGEKPEQQETSHASLPQAAADLTPLASPTQPVDANVDHAGPRPERQPTPTPAHDAGNAPAVVQATDSAAPAENAADATPNRPELSTSDHTPDQTDHHARQPSSDEPSAHESQAENDRPPSDGSETAHHEHSHGPQR